MPIDPNTFQNAETDAHTISDVVNGPAVGTGSTVTTRLGQSIDSLAKASSGITARVADIDTALANASAALAAASSAQSAANSATIYANIALSQLTDISNDNLLTPLEKGFVIQDYNVITGEQAGIDAEAVLYVDAAVTAAKSVYDTNIGLLTTYLNGLTTPTVWNSLTGNTNLPSGIIFRQKFQDVYTARSSVLNAISTRAKVIADTAQAGINSAAAQAAQANLVLKSSFPLVLSWDTFDTSDWNLRNGSFANLFTVSGKGQAGGNVLRGSGFQWISWKYNLVYDPSRLYRVRVRVRQAKNSTSGSPTFFVGLEGVDLNGSTLVSSLGLDSSSSQHYGPANVTLTAAGNTINDTLAGPWIEYIFYWKGLSLNDVNGGTGSINPLTPGVLKGYNTVGTAWTANAVLTVATRKVNGGKLYEVITPGTTAPSVGPFGTSADITDGTVHWKYITTDGVKYVRPLIIFNYSTGDGWVDVDTLEISSDPGDAAQKTADNAGTSVAGVISDALARIGTFADMASRTMSDLTQTILQGKIADGTFPAAKLAPFTASQLQAVTFGGGNLLPNASLEACNIEAGVPDSWNFDSGGQWTLGGFDHFLDDGSGRQSGKAWKIIWANMPAGGVCAFRCDGLFPFALNQWYSLSWYAWAEGSALGRMFSFGGGSDPQEAIWSNGTSPVLTGSWQRFSLRFRWTSAPRNPGFIAIYPAQFTSALSGSCTIDDIQLEEGEVSTAFAPKVSELLPGVIGTTQIYDGAITTRKLITGAVTASKMLITNFDNLVPNPNSELVPPGGWPPEAVEGAGLDTVNPYKGLNCRVIYPSIQTIITEKIPVGFSDQFYVEAMIARMNGGAAASLVIVGYDASGTYLGNVIIISGSGSVPIAYEKVSGNFTIGQVAGTDVAFICLALYVNPSAIGPATFDNFYMRRMGDGNLIVDGSISTKHIATKTITAAVMAISDFENLCQDPSCEADGTPAFWTTNSTRSVVAANTIDAALAATQKALRWDGRDLYGGVPFICVPGETFYIEMDVYTVNSPLGTAGTNFNAPYSTGGGITYLDKDQNCLNWAGPRVPNGVAGKQSAAGMTTAPAGTCYAKIWLSNLGYGGGGELNTGYVFVRNLSVRRQNAGKLILDGTLTASKIIAGAIEAYHLKVGPHFNFKTQNVNATDSTAGGYTPGALAAIDGDGAISLPITRNGITAVFNTSSANWLAEWLHPISVNTPVHTFEARFRQPGTLNFGIIFNLATPFTATQGILVNAEGDYISVYACNGPGNITYASVNSAAATATKTGNDVLTVQWYNTLITPVDGSTPIRCRIYWNGKLVLSITTIQAANFPSVSRNLAISGYVAFDLNTSAIKVSDITIGQYSTIISDGSITANTLAVATLSAITANVGTLTAGTIKSTDNKTRFDVSAGRIFFNTGSMMHVIGAGFGTGTDSPFVEWIGPSQGSIGAEDLTLCTSANAKFYVSAAGTVKFAGILSVGQTVNAVKASVLNSSCLADLGPFTANANQITVNVQYAFNGNTNYAATSAGVTAYNSASKVAPTLQLILSRSLNGAAFVDVATYTPTTGVASQVPVIIDLAPGYINQYGNGSWTYLDNGAVAQTREFKVRISVWTNVTTVVTQNDIAIQSIQS